MNFVVFTPSPNTMTVIKSRRWTGNASKILTGKSIGRRTLRRIKQRWEDNIRMDLKEICINKRKWVDST